MATKAETYQQMANHATESLTAQVRDWTKFLLMAGRFCKYQFLEVLMIRIQRENATACAGYDLWKQRMNRQVRYGSKGIALLRYRDGRVFLRYVFDVADTERRENGRDPMLWQYQDEYEGAVTSHLEECFKVPGGDGLAKQLIGLEDYRLRVFRQVCKRGVLPPDMEEASIAALAANLDSKPLDAWIRTDFGHIGGLTTGDAAQLLAHLDMIRPILPGIRTRADALLVLRNLDTLGQYTSVAELKDNLLHTDADWLALVKRMDLTPEFQEEHRESIVRFLCGNGAYIAETYANGLNGKQRTAFLRVVKAELMGQMADLKYFEGDLQRELDSPLTARVKAGWPVNLGVAEHGLEVREHDDFFSTMLLGVQPQRTCMSYIDGQYKECLLSAFDSNKKILYATLNGRIVGRAFLRLTKGGLTGADVPADDSGFTFVDLERPDARPARAREREGLALFLERPYISGAGPEVSLDIMRMFVELAERKANELDTMLVLSADYRSKVTSGFTWTKYAVYISKSKAGAQYLDSLGGQATVSAEGSYRANSFLVREAA